MKKLCNKKGHYLFKFGVISAIVAGAISISGCSAVGTMIEHHSLETNTKMSDSIFLNPAPNNQKTVYISTRNTSGQAGLSLTNDLKKDLRAGGYKVMSAPASAHYMIQANIIKAGKTNNQNIDSIVDSGYGGVISGGLIGLGVGRLTGDSTEGVVTGGFIGAAGGYLANTLVKDQVFALVTDVQISVRAGKGQSFKSQTTSNMSQGSSTQQVTQSTGSTQWMRYRARVVVTADKVNLKFSEAKPVLQDKTAQSISGLFINS